MPGWGTGKGGENRVQNDQERDQRGPMACAMALSLGMVSVYQIVRGGYNGCLPRGLPVYARGLIGRFDLGCKKLLEAAVSRSSDHTWVTENLGMCPGDSPAMIDRARTGCLQNDERTRI